MDVSPCLAKSFSFATHALDNDSAIMPGRFSLCMCELRYWPQKGSQCTGEPCLDICQRAANPSCPAAAAICNAGDQEEPPSSQPGKNGLYAPCERPSARFKPHLQTNRGCLFLGHHGKEEGYTLARISSGWPPTFNVRRRAVRNGCSLISPDLDNVG
jgi:hypothetical protein